LRRSHYGSLQKRALPICHNRSIRYRVSNGRIQSHNADTISRHQQPSQGDYGCVGPAYRDFATREFKKILKFDAADWLFDEVCHHGPVEYSFSQTHGYAAPGFIYGGDVPFAHQMRVAANALDLNFIFSGEGPQDWFMQYYPVSYFRIGAGSCPVYRLIGHLAPLVVAVTGCNDREKLNLIFLNRYIISYAMNRTTSKVTLRIFL